MKISISWLQEKNACPEGIEWFREKYPEHLDGVGYQSILDDLSKENKHVWADWLMLKAGSTNEVLEIKGNLTLEHSLFFAGSIKVSKNISVGGDVTSGRGVTAGGDVKVGGGVTAGGDVTAGRDVKVGGGVTAGGDVTAGRYYGIYVGLLVRGSQKSENTIVYSKTKPKNLILGEWQETK